MSERYYFSKPIEVHYQKSKSQAISFLFTIGAKALAIAEQRHELMARSTKSIGQKLIKQTLDGINEEAEIKVEIDIEENIRTHKRKINEKIPITVHKLSANGQTRTMHIKIHHGKHSGSSIKWKSKFNTKKHVLLENTLSIRSLGPHSIEDILNLTAHKDIASFNSVHNNASSSGIGTNPTTATTTSTTPNNICAELPFIRFENSRKQQVNLKFSSYEEMVAFIQCVETCQPAVQYTV